MNEKEIKAKKIMQSIGHVLLHEWDPIGVKEVPEAQDEYDSYIGGVYRLLTTSPSANQIAEHLARIENEEMGLGKRKIHDLLPVAKKLMSMDIKL